MDTLFSLRHMCRRHRAGRQYALIILTFVALLGSGGQALALTCQIETAPGAYSAAFEVSNTDQRYFLYKVPDNYDPSNSAGYPLVVAFHGAGQSAWSFADRPGQVRMRDLADVEDFILVYPQGTSLNMGNEAAATCPPVESEHASAAGWNGAHCCTNANDLEFIDELLVELTLELNVDSDRVYAVGYSNGGMFTHLLGGMRSETFAAIASVSSTVGGSAIKHGPFTKPIAARSLPLTRTRVPPLPTRVPVPVLMMNSERDPTIPFHGSLRHLSNEASFSHWWSANECVHPVLATSLLSIADSTGAEHTAMSVSSGCDTNTTTIVNVVFDSIHQNVNLNHSWPDLNTNGYDASGEIVDFLFLHSL